jgi:hypothetical protein
LVQMHSFQSCYVDKKVAGCIEAVVAVDWSLEEEDWGTN